MAQDPIKLALKLAKEPLKKKKRKHFEEGGPDHESETKDTETKDTGDDVRKGDMPGGLSGDTGEFSQKVDESQGAINTAVAKAQDAQQGMREINDKFGSPDSIKSFDTPGANSPFADPNFKGYPSTDTSYLFGPSSPSNPPLAGPITTAAGMSAPQLDAANAQYVEQQQIQDAIQAQADAAENAAMNANNALLMRAGPVTGLGGTPSVTSPDQRLLDAALSRAGTITGGDSGTALNAALSRTGPLTGVDGETALNSGDDTVTRLIAALYRTGPMTGDTSGMPSTPYSAVRAYRDAITPNLGVESSDAALNAALSRTGPMTGDTTGMPSTPYSAVRAYRDAITPSLGAGPSDAALRLARDTITQNLGGTGGGAAVTGGGGTAPTFPGNKVPTPPIPVRDLQGPDIAEKVAGFFGLSTQQQLDKFYKQYTDQGLNETDAYNKAIGDIQTMRANAKPGPFDRSGHDAEMQARMAAAAAAATPATVATTDTTTSTPFKLPGVNQPYIPSNTPSTGTGYADLGANASALRQAQYTQAIKNALLLANGNQYYG